MASLRAHFATHKSCAHILAPYAGCQVSLQKNALIFMEQNKYSKLAIVALIVSSVLSAFVLGTTALMLLDHENIEPLALLMGPLILFGVLINLFIAFKIYRGSFKYIKVAFWLYIIQVVSIETLNFSFYLSLGFTVLISWSIGSVTIALNLFAIFMSVLLYKVKKNVHET